MNRQAVIDDIIKEKIIVIVRGVESESLIPLAEAMYEGGVRAIEITYSMNGAVSDEETAENIRMLVSHFAGRMRVGAGTVLTEKQVELTAAAGGEFIISPDANPEVIRKTKELGMLSMPGAFTPTEVVTAHEAGADFVKVFPVDALGPAYLKALKAPLCHIKMLAVGGVNETNLGAFLAAGASGFGIGSNVVNKKMIAEGNFDGITELARAFLAALAHAESEA